MDSWKASLLSVMHVVFESKPLFSTETMPHSAVLGICSQSCGKCCAVENFCRIQTQPHPSQTERSTRFFCFLVFSFGSISKSPHYYGAYALLWRWIRVADSVVSVHTHRAIEVLSPPWHLMVCLNPRHFLRWIVFLLNAQCFQLVIQISLVT